MPLDSPYRDPVIKPIRTFSGARDHAMPRDRLREVRNRARVFREQMLDKQPVEFYRTFDLIKAPYPTRYGLRDACRLPTPYIHILNRLFVVQFQTSEGIKTLLAEPLDRTGNSETPFYKRLARRMGGPTSSLTRTLYPTLNEVLPCLRSVGIAPEAVDYITYDHLHTQDIRRWLGSPTSPGAFPNAKLLVTRREWEAVKGLLPLQSEWYPPHGTDGVPEDRIILLDDDVMLGDSVALLRTPGHTEGNHSIVVHAGDQLLVTSENGVCADAYAPHHSRIPGLRKFATETGAEVVMNGNTLESSVDQYISMIQELEVAGPCPRNQEFFNVVCSSEMVPHWLSPGLSPTFRFDELEFGSPQTSPR